MTLQKPALWWPIRRHEGSAAENSYLEFWIRTGNDPGPYTYYPGAVGAEPATGAVIELTRDAVNNPNYAALPWPYGYDAWRSIYRYMAAVEYAMEAVASKPAGFAVTVSCSAAGVLTLAYTSADPNTCVRFEWGAAAGAATSYPAAAAVMGLDTTTSAVYATSHTATRGHAAGCYVAADAGACLAESTGPTWSDVETQEVVTLYGQTMATAQGGRYRRRMTLDFLTADQIARLEELYHYGTNGGGLILSTEGLVWGDLPLSHVCGERFRQEWAPRKPYPGLARWQAELDLYALA